MRGVDVPPQQEEIARAKAALRETLRARRREVSPDTARAAGEQIAARVAALAVYHYAVVVLVYIPLRPLGELDTWPLIESAWRDGKQVWAPRVVGPGTMAWGPVRSVLDLAPDHYGILSPRRTAALPEAPSVCVVPGLAFTVDGARLGQGGGFYDRFLDGYGGTSLGVAYAWQRHDALPQAPHDRSVSRVFFASAT